jgi:hypothetical protein
MANHRFNVSPQHCELEPTHQKYTASIFEQLTEDEKQCGYVQHDNAAVHTA